jgi:hypothetical protein
LLVGCNNIVGSYEFVIFFIGNARRGIISIGFFATKNGMAAAYPNTPLVSWGIFCERHQPP